MVSICHHHANGDSFDTDDLYQHLLSLGGQIVVGAQQVVLREHTKPHSLDVWLRHCCHLPDTKQATNALLDEILSKDPRFRRDQVEDPKNGRVCDGLAIV